MMLSTMIIIGVALFIIVAIVAVYITKYKTVGPDEALIVTGSFLGSKMSTQMTRVTALKLFVVEEHSFSGIPTI